jgi:hypothetical protein
MNSTITITLTEEQMKNIQEGKPITIEPPRGEPEKFRCREENRYFATRSGIANSSINRHQEEFDNYAYQSTEQEALEFENLRKQLAIQFEFLKQHAPDYKPNWLNKREPKNYCFYDHELRKWRDGCEYAIQVVKVYMPLEVAELFCEMANSRIIEGLEL